MKKFINRQKMTIRGAFSISRLLHDYAYKQKSFCFLQIGANDGVMNDPLYEHIKGGGWTGLLVEPVAYYCQKLRKLHRERPGISVDNCAVAAKTEIKNLYRLDEEYLKQNYADQAWLHGQGSFNREHVVNEIIRHYPNDHNGLISAIISDKVQCLTIDDLFERNQIGSVDLIAVDTQGYDYEILEMIDFQRFRPGILMFESEVVAGRKDCIEKLIKVGYKIFYQNEFDTVMVDPSKPFFQRRLRFMKVIKLLSVFSGHRV